MAVQFNMQRIGEGKQTWLNVWPMYALVVTQIAMEGLMKEFKKWNVPKEEGSGKVE